MSLSGISQDQLLHPLSPHKSRNWGNALGWPIGKATSFSRRRYSAINAIMINEARQCPLGLETWSWSMPPPSRADTKSRVGARTGSVWWSSSPYPNLPVYVICSIDGEGYSHALHWNFLLPISHNLEQDEGKIAVEGTSSNEPTPVPHEEDACQPTVQPELTRRHVSLATKTMWTSWPRANQVNHPGLYGWRAPHSQWCTCSTKVKLKEMKNQLPLRYWNLQHGKMMPFPVP